MSSLRRKQIQRNHTALRYRRQITDGTHMKILYFLRDNGACGYYRLALPLEKWGKQNGTQMGHWMRGDSKERLMEWIDYSDILVVPRMGEESFLKDVPIFKEMGKKIVIDHDDNMFKISPLSPHYEDSGTQEVIINWNGKKMPMWVDITKADQYKGIEPAPGIIDIQKNKQWQDDFKECLRQADMVTVT